MAKYRHDHRARIVVVDDHPLIANAIARFLEIETGIEVAGVAHNADTGCKMALLEGPDLALMDVEMPGRSPFDACREIVTRSGGATKVLLYADFPRASYADRAMQAGASGLASKGLETAAELQAVIHAILSGEQYVSPYWKARVDLLNEGAEPLPAAKLTPHEVDVLIRLAAGRKPADIAKGFKTSPSAVHHTIRRCRDKLSCTTNERLMILAAAEGVVSISD